MVKEVQLWVKNTTLHMNKIAALSTPCSIYIYEEPFSKNMLHILNPNLIHCI